MSSPDNYYHNDFPSEADNPVVSLLSPSEYARYFATAPVIVAPSSSSSSRQQQHHHHHHHQQRHHHTRHQSSGSNAMNSNYGGSNHSNYSSTREQQQQQRPGGNENSHNNNSNNNNRGNQQVTPPSTPGSRSPLPSDGNDNDDDELLMTTTGGDQSPALTASTPSMSLARVAAAVNEQDQEILDMSRDYQDVDYDDDDDDENDGDIAESYVIHYNDYKDINDNDHHGDASDFLLPGQTLPADDDDDDEDFGDGNPNRNLYHQKQKKRRRIQRHGNNKNSSNSNYYDEEDDQFTTLKQDCRTTAEEIERLLTPLREREARLQEKRLEEKNDYLSSSWQQQKQQDEAPSNGTSSFREIALVSNNDHHSLSSPTQHRSEENNSNDDHQSYIVSYCNNSTKAKDDPFYSKLVTEKDEEDIRIAVHSIQTQMHIKELQQKEMELMRLTGTEMEDMVLHEDTFKYSEYVKTLSSGAALTNHDHNNNSNIAEIGSMLDENGINNSASSTSLHQQQQQQQHNQPQLVLENTSLLLAAERRQKPRLFDIVAAKPPPLRDIPGVRDHLIVDELPPDPELVPVYHTGSGVEKDVAVTGQVVGGSKLALSRESPVSVILEKKNMQVLLRGGGGGCDDDNENTATTNENENNNTNDKSHRSIDGKDSERNDHHHGTSSSIVTNETAAKLKKDTLQPVAGVMSTYHAASPHLFDISRHSRHRAVFSGAMKNWKDAKDEEEQRRVLAGGSGGGAHRNKKYGRSVILNQNSPLRIFDRKGEFRNRGLATAAVQDDDHSNDNDHSQVFASGGDEDTITVNQISEEKKERVQVEEKNGDEPKKKDLRQLLAEQQSLIRKAEKEDVETYQPMVKNFVEYNESMAEKMWSRFAGVS